jgi:molybdenum cofactor cytidylyltransferase
MLLHAVAAAATLGGPVVVVTGAHAEQVYPLLESLPGSLRQQLQVVYNQDWEVGQASSLHTSLRSLPAAAEAAIWMPVDQPYLDPLLLAQLAAAWRRGADLAAPQVEGELRGAPALFDRRFWPELLTVAGDRGGRAVLQRYAAHVEGIPTTGNLLRDIDYPSDLT